MFSSRLVLRELDIGPDPRLGEAELTNVPAGAVVAGSVVAFAASISQQHGHDVLQSLLLAQLAANAKASRHKDPLNWYKAYQSTFESIGWVAFASTNFTRYIPPVGRYTIAAVIRDVLRTKTTPEEFELVNSTLSAFARDESAPAQFVWECPSHSGGIGNFQVGLATEEDNGTVTLQLGRFAFETTAQVIRLAFEEFGRDAKFQTSYVAMTLDEEVFARLRTAIEKKLESRFNTSVARIDLSPE
jgi:hypothetical protein